MKKIFFLQSVLSFTRSDFEELSNIYALEYNKPELHDRVLVLDVFKEECESTQIAVTLVNGDEEEVNTSSPDSPDCENTDKESNQSNSSQAKATKRKNSQESDDARPVDKKKPRVLLSSEMGIDTEDGQETGHSTAEGEADVSSVGALTEAERGPVVELSSLTTVSDVSNNDLPRQHKIFVHSTWLAVHSSYFRSLFYSGLSESHLKEVHLKIPECEEKGHLLLLEAMYKPDILNEASVDDLLVVLELADKYQVKFVFRKCKYVLKSNATSIEDCEKMVLIVRMKQNMTDVEDLIEKITAFLVQTFSPLDETWQRDSFVNLSEVLVSCLLSSDDLTTQSENTVFHALMHWIELNELDKSSENLNASPLLSVVRFEFLTMDYLFCVVQHHPIATQMLHFNDAYLKGVTYHALQEDVKKRLKVKPVERKTPVGDIVQYRWTVLTSEIAGLTPTTGILTSDAFWSCGYRMKITAGNFCNYSNGHRLSSINLHVLDLVQESFVPINFSFKYKSCHQDNEKLDYSHNFSMDSQMFSNTQGSLDLLKTEQSSNIDLIIAPK